MSARKRQTTIARLSGFVSVLLLTSAVLTGGEARPDAGQRPFTTRDSIEISYIVDPARFTDIGTRERQDLGGPIFSPDNRLFVLITQRGVLTTNEIEGVIWLFDTRAIRPLARAAPARQLVTMSAIGNTPVIEDVRWIGSRRIAFLAKNHSPYVRVFDADVKTGAVRALTGSDVYVTAFDVQGDTVAYTALAFPSTPPKFKEWLVPVGEQSIYDLLYRNASRRVDLGESLRARLPSTLHIQKKGRELPLHFRNQGRPLWLFVPILALSPDSAFLITVAPVYQVPAAWDKYPPADQYFRFPSGPVPESRVMTIDSVWRPERYTLINLNSGLVAPLLDAPAGRDMGYSIPTRVFWNDAGHVIVTNTFLPVSNPETGHTGNQDPTAASINVGNNTCQKIADLKSNTGIESFEWNSAGQIFTIRHKTAVSSPALPLADESYHKQDGHWARGQAARADADLYTSGSFSLQVREDLNRPAQLWARDLQSNREWLLWDPNPRICTVALGRAAIYQWRDSTGRQWSGILATPPEYIPGRRYPLVIQTHGYQQSRFFADGYATTASGGRALAARGVVVLQMEECTKHDSTPEENTEQSEGFASAINHLVADGLVDRERVGIIGFSRTAQHVLFALTHYPDLFAAAMVTSPDFSYVNYVMWSKGFGATGPQKEAEGMNGGAPYGSGLLLWLQNAAGFKLDKTKAPLLILAFGKGGLISQWEALSILRRLRKPVDMVWCWREDVPHFVVQPRDRFATQQLAIDWFDFWLNGHEPASSLRSKQFVRWRQLRALQSEQGNRNASDP